MPPGLRYYYIFLIACVDQHRRRLFWVFARAPRVPKGITSSASTPETHKAAVLPSFQPHCVQGFDLGTRDRPAWRGRAILWVMFKQAHHAKVKFPFLPFGNKKTVKAWGGCVGLFILDDQINSSMLEVDTTSQLVGRRVRCA